jgi:spore germination protein YaaH
MKNSNRSLFIILLLSLILISSLIIRMVNTENNLNIVNKSQKENSTSKDYKPYVGEINKSIFIPYWSLNSSSSLNSYDRLIYFGISGTVEGIDKSDSGYLNLQKFIALSPDQSQKYLTVRMLNTQENIKILNQKNSMDKIIEESIDVAIQNGFQGIVLDLEIGVLFGDEIINKVSDFSNNFYRELIEKNLKYSIAIYGDLFYRGRPYDLSVLAKNSDEIMIMAYDFHKSIGEPGPNFPLNGKENYGYDMTVLIDDFLTYLEPDKLSIIFGMYGYEWIVDDKDRPIKSAQSLSLNQIRTKHSNDCNGERCEFVDSEGRRHIIWHENEESVSEKIEYLKNRGIGNFAYWATGYF